ncbi:MAG: arabinan endo-1,5-alpha-L-arabinosidase, partial [Muribaculaceae bacterium]|nr:arabinan endo-1,5-alpha-L-arabinosidase [Muribaculaceae bacterium]
MKSYKYILLLPIISLVACSDKNEEIQEVCPVTLTVPVISETNSSSIKVSATFTLLNETADFNAAGFCYSLSENPTIYDSAVKGEVEDGNISATITRLKPESEYTIRAFVSRHNGATVYSEPIQFTTGTGTLEDALYAYEPPKYEDYYVNVMGWEKRDKWNLSNVHDPTVMLADDGYYYMYQTDATYGDTHKGHGHFHGRRSKDLVNWEYLGGTMPALPEWLSKQCNAFRAEIGLPALDIKENNVNFWAPVARSIGNGTYRMYYALGVVMPIQEGSSGGNTAWEEKAFIGLMETRDPASNIWEDKGFVVCSSSDRNKDWFVAGDYSKAYYKFNAID